MNLTWLGHASFLIEDNNGTKIVTDPFDETVGYPLFRGNTDIVTISHEHFDHNYTALLHEDVKILRNANEYQENNITIESFPSFHDEVKGAKRGPNTIFKFNFGNITICHLGDLGHMLDDEVIDLIGNIDVLLIPVGGNYTIGGEEAALLAKKINSKITIPMHYKTPQLTFELDGVETFLTNMKTGEKISSNSIKIEDFIEDDKNKVLILNSI